MMFDMDEEQRDKILEERKKWYNLTYVNFEIVKCLNDRELCFLSAKSEERKFPVRYLMAFSINYLKKHMERFGFLKNLMNMYHSVSVLKDLPIFSYNPRKRKEDYRYKEFNENYEDYVVGYNLFIDLDSKGDWKKALQDTLEIKKIFDEYRVPYYILSSSLKGGFHVHIPSEYMPKKNIHELIAEINEVVYNIRGIYSLESIDTSIFDIKRVCKVPYSLSSDGGVCLPLSDEMLKIFTPEMIKTENVLKKIMIKNRGLLLRTHNLDKDTLKKNVLKLFEDFS